MRAATCIHAFIALLAITPASAAAATWNVSPDGADTNSGSEASPFRTISRAAVVAAAGDVVRVEAGRYAETVTLSGRHDGVTFRGVGDGAAVVDGEGSRAFGFKNVGADELTIENFEVTGQTQTGIATDGPRAVISGNLIHHVGSADVLESTGVRVWKGRDARVAGNEIHHIGPGGESRGIWLLETRGATVEDNSVYFARKEGVRDWKGLDNSIKGNRFFLNWVGLSLNTSTGSIASGNYVYDNVQGIVVKHASSAGALDLWQLTTGRLTRVLNNTVYRSTDASIWIAQSGTPLDHLEVRGNLFSGAGTAYVRDRPELRGADVVLDGNSYSANGGSPRWIYKAGYSSSPGLTDWLSVREATGWEQSATAAAGAAAIAPAGVTWTPYAMQPVDSSSKGTWYTRNHLDKTSDNDWSTYWASATGANEYVAFDFGQRRSFNHLVLTVYGHGDLRNPRGYRFETSDNGIVWDEVGAGVNPDPQGAAYFYELSRTETARYLRFTMVDTFCASYLPRLGCGESFLLSDLKAGLLQAETDDGGPDMPSAGGETPLPGIEVPVPGLQDGPDAPGEGQQPDRTPPANPPANPPARLVVGTRAVLTRRGRLRLRVNCVGAASGRGSLNVVGRTRKGRSVRLGSGKLQFKPGCPRSLQLRVRRAALGALRDGRVKTIRVTAVAPGGEPVTTRLRVRR